MSKRDWEYDLWVHLSDHVKQKTEPDEPDDCQHCKEAEVDCPDCQKLLIEWASHNELDDVGPPTHQRMRAALEHIAGLAHTPSHITWTGQTGEPVEISTCAGLPYCQGCVALEALNEQAVGPIPEESDDPLQRPHDPADTRNPVIWREVMYRAAFPYVTHEEYLDLPAAEVDRIANWLGR